QARARRPENSGGLVPEAGKDERTEHPLRDSEEPARAADAEDGVHPGDERAVADERDQRLRLVLPPLLVSEEEEDDHHRRAQQMVIEVAAKKSRSTQHRRQQRSNGSHPDLLSPADGLSWCNR